MLDGARRLTTCAPGAATSGWRASSPRLAQSGATNAPESSVSRPADRDDERIARRQAQPRHLGTVVARRRDDHDARRPRPLDRCRQRARAVVGAVVGVEREVDHPDVELVGVRDHPVDAGDDARRRDGALAIGDLHRDDARPGCDAREAGRGVVAGDDAREVRAVTVAVAEAAGRVDDLGGEVDGRDHCVPQRRDGSDAGVDDRDVHAGAGDALRPERAGADLVGDRAERHGVGGVGDDGVDRGDGRRRGVGREVVELRDDPTAGGDEQRDDDGDGRTGARPRGAGAERGTPHATASGGRPRAHDVGLTTSETGSRRHGRRAPPTAAPATARCARDGRRRAGSGCATRDPVGRVGSAGRLPHPAAARARGSGANDVDGRTIGRQEGHGRLPSVCDRRRTGRSLAVAKDRPSTAGNEESRPQIVTWCLTDT